MVSGHRPVNLIERTRDLIDPRFRAGAHVRTRMKDDGCSAEALGAVELVGERGDGLAVKLRIGGCQIDEIRSMREDRPHGSHLLEQRAIVVRQLFALPLIRVLGEEGDGGGVDHRGALKDGVQSTLRGQMSTDQVAVFR